jgi:uncharacterized protein (TIGR00251 family)
LSETLPPWLRQAGDDVVLSLHIQPGAKRTEVAGVHGDSLKVRLNAQPVDGKANDALVAYLAERLGVPKARVVLEAGQTSRSKRVRVLGVAAEAVVATLK